MKTITVHELHELSQTQTVELIDVRTPEEFRSGRASMAKHVPMDRIDPHQLMQTRELADTEPIFFICHLGGRSAHVCDAMTAAGYPNVVNVEGGTEAWLAAGFPAEIS
jgi:rhodanese-related sulfurtransferase